MGKIRGDRCREIAGWVFFFSWCYSCVESLVCEMQDYFQFLLKLVHLEYLLCVFGAFFALSLGLSLMWNPVFTDCSWCDQRSGWQSGCENSQYLVSLSFHQRHGSVNAGTIWSITVSPPNSHSPGGICWYFYRVGKKYLGKEFIFLIFKRTNRILGHVWCQQTCVMPFS